MYAIFIMLITLIVIGSIITIAFHHRNYMEREIARQNLVSYTQSVLTAALCDSTLSFPWDGKSLNLTENPNYTFSVTKERWGGYFIISITGKYGNYELQKKALCGTKGVLNDGAALYLTDNNNALSISGNTQLIGDCYLPKAGIKASYMEGDYYRGKKLVYGDILVSGNVLPTIDEEYLTYMDGLLEGKLKITDSILDFASISTSEFYNPFYNKTLYLVSKEPLFLNRCKFIGNIAIISSQPITIFPTAELTDVMVIAPKIIFKKEWVGSLQAYARDTILLEQNVRLQFPSTIGVQSTKNLGLIELNRGVRVDGSIWMTKNSKEKENKNSCMFSPGTIVHGITQIEGKLSVEGKIYGSVYVEKFIFRTVSSYYENHLYNVEINAKTLSPFYASAALNKNRGCKMIKMLEP